MLQEQLLGPSKIFFQLLQTSKEHFLSRNRRQTSQLFFISDWKMLRHDGEIVKSQIWTKRLNTCYSCRRLRSDALTTSFDFQVPAGNSCSAMQHVNNLCLVQAHGAREGDVIGISTWTPCDKDRLNMQSRVEARTLS